MPRDPWTFQSLSSRQDNLERRRNRGSFSPASLIPPDQLFSTFVETWIPEISVAQETPNHHRIFWGPCRRAFSFYPSAGTPPSPHTFRAERKKNTKPIGKSSFSIDTN